MAKMKRLFRSFSGLLLPILFLLVVAVAAASVWLVYKTAEPPKSVYLVTPEKYGQLSARGAQVTAETWSDRDGTTARGWLLRGAENAPAVILMHRYGADRSHVLNMGVKMNEATDFTILMPDARGHGENSASRDTSFGGSESEDALAAIEFLRALKTPMDTALVGKSIGLYGVEMGALTAVNAAAKDNSVKALVVDSVPQDSNDLLAAAVSRRFPFASSVTARFAQAGTYFYFYNGNYRREEACDAAKAITSRQVLLLAGSDAPHFQDSTQKLSKCFPSTTRIEVKTDLSPSGYNSINASLEHSEAYDQRVIEFFRGALGEQLLSSWKIQKNFVSN